MRNRGDAKGSPDILQEYLQDAPKKTRREMAARAKQRGKDTIPFSLRLAGEKVAPKEVLGQKIVDSVWQKLLVGESVSVGEALGNIAESAAPRNPREARAEERFLYQFGEEFRKAMLRHDFKKVDELYLDAIQTDSGGKSVRGMGDSSRYAALEKVSRSCTEVVAQMVNKRDDWDLAILLRSQSSFLNHLFSDPYFISVVGRIVPLTESHDRRQSSTEFLRIALSRALSDAIGDDSGMGDMTHNSYLTAMSRVQRFGLPVPDIRQAVHSDPVQRRIRETLRHDLYALSDLTGRDSFPQMHALEIHLQDKVRRLRTAKMIDEQSFNRLVRDIAMDYKKEYGQALRKLIVFKPIEPQG